MYSRSLIACSLAASLWCVASSADAQPSASQRNAWLDQAQTLVDRAAKRYVAGNYAAALADLQNAERLADKAQDPSLASIRFNIARCYEQLGQPEKALEAYERYDKLPDKPHRKQKAFLAMQDLEQRVYSVLIVDCGAARAVLSIPGVVEGVSCPYRSQRIKPGAYRVIATTPSSETRTELVELKAGAAEQVNFQFKTTAQAIVEAPPPPPSSRGPSALPWVTMGTGLAAAGAGGVLTALALDARAEAEDLPPGTSRDDKVSDFDTFNTASVILYSVGGAAIAGGLLWFFLDQGGDDAGSAQLRPTLDGFVVQF